MLAIGIFIYFVLILTAKTAKTCGSWNRRSEIASPRAHSLCSVQIQSDVHPAAASEEESKPHMWALVIISSFLSSTAICYKRCTGNDLSVGPRVCKAAKKKPARTQISNRPSSSSSSSVRVIVVAEPFTDAQQPTLKPAHIINLFALEVVFEKIRISLLCWCAFCATQNIHNSMANFPSETGEGNVFLGAYWSSFSNKVLVGKHKFAYTRKYTLALIQRDTTMSIWSNAPTKKYLKILHFSMGHHKRFKC